MHAAGRHAQHARPPGVEVQVIGSRSLLLRAFVVAVVAVVGFAQPAWASWRAHDVPTRGPAAVADVDGLPGGRVAMLLRRATGSHRATLELWIGRRHTVVATGGAFGDGKIGHDAQGRVVVAFVRLGTVDVWTAAHGSQPVATGFNSFSGSLDVAVAPSGRAVVSVALGERGVRLVRGTTTGGFASPAQTLPSSSPASAAAVGIADDGTATIAYNNTWVARAPWGGQPVVAQLTTATAPTEWRDFALTVTGSGRAVIGLRGSADLPGGRRDTVAISTWDSAAAAPGPLTEVFGGTAGQLVAVAAGDTAFLAWRAQARQDPVAVTGIGLATVTPDGTVHQRFTIPGHGGAGAFDARHPVLAASGTGARIYVNVGCGIHTIHIAPNTALTATTVITASGAANPIVSATQGNDRPLIAWTRYLHGTEGETRIRVATPR
jgi:hypothetical protein